MRIPTDPHRIHRRWTRALRPLVRCGADRQMAYPQTDAPPVNPIPDNGHFAMCAACITYFSCCLVYIVQTKPLSLHESDSSAMREGAEKTSGFRRQSLRADPSGWRESGRHGVQSDAWWRADGATNGTTTPTGTVEFFNGASEGGERNVAAAIGRQETILISGNTGNQRVIRARKPKRPSVPVRGAEFLRKSDEIPLLRGSPAQCVTTLFRRRKVMQELQ